MGAGVSRQLGRVAIPLVAVLAVSLLGQPPANARPSSWTPPKPVDVTGIPVIDATAGWHRPEWSAQARAVRGPQAVRWPTPGTATAVLPAVSATTPTRVGALPVMVTPVAQAEPISPKARPASRPGAVTVAMHDHRAAINVGGFVLFGVSRADGQASAAPVTVGLDYSGFAHAYGGDWASRLRLVRLPACAATTPQLTQCQSRTALPTVNDAAGQRLSTTISVGGNEPTMLAAAAAPSGENGDYTATSLSPAGTWQVSMQTGDFAWSYPLRMPPALGGPAPSVTFAYASGSIDGRTATSNNQGSWIGDGWDSWPGHIERTYASCVDDNPSHKTGDQCWFSDNATLTLNGRSGELVKSGSVWRLTDDDATKVERLNDSARGNGDNDNEYWKVTTTDGTQYFFGYHKLPGWTSGKPVTDSTWTTEVFGNNSGEPCYSATFANARCTQAWRWNLDYVVDPNGNTMAYFYANETGAYGRDNTPTLRTTYHRGGYLQRVEYGMRQGSEYAQAAPLRVVFTTAERCLSGCWAGAAWTSDPNPSAWPDTPWDQYCKAEPCNEQLTPTFWSARRLTQITAQVRSGTSTYRDVESWALRQEFLNAGTGEGTPMWLRGITRTGHVTTAGGATVADPEIVFDPGAEPLPNRVDGPADGRTALNRWRIKVITTESGGQVVVTYSGPDCTRSNLPTPSNNSKRCMPAYYSPSGTPTLDWFHKYVVTRVDLDDTVTDQLNQTTMYDYLDSPAWHYNTDEITKDKHRTWGEWRGYGRVQVRQGDPSGAQTAVEYRYLRGMDGDKQPTGTRDVWVADTWGTTIEDHEALRGFERQAITFNGANGTEVSSTLNVPWKTGPTATRTRNGVTTNAWKTDTETVRTRTALAAGGFRTSKSTTAFNADGLPTTVDDSGDESATGDETCARTTYARNDPAWIIETISQVEKLSVACAAAANPAAPATVLSRSRTFYDTYSGEASFGAAPTKGNPVRTEELSAWSGSTPVYVRTASNVYDSNGRVTAATDARSFTTTTAFTTANGGLVTQTLVTNPLGNQVTTVKEPAWDLPTTTTDPNGAVTDLSYDGLGRLTSVWLPGRAKATQTPSVRFTYLLRKSGGPTAVTTENLLPTGSAYKKQVTLYDGLLRQRQTQSQATGGGRLLTDTFYTTRGEVDWTSEAYYDSTNSPPSTSLGAPQGQIPAINSKRYDGAGRETDTILLANGVEKWRTTTAYGGDRVHTTPPLGGTATTAISNIFDETVELRQYHSPAQVGNENPSTFDKTTYVYGLTGSLQRVTDAAGNQWSYQYDLRGRQTQAIDPDKGTTTSTYDDGGNVLTTTSPLGSGAATVAYTYDALSRRTTMRDTSATGPKRAEWVYDTATLGIGKLARSIRWVGTAAYESRVNAYDTAGRPTSTSVILPATEGALCAAGGTTPCTFTTSVTYRANGSPFQTTLPAAANLASEKLTFGYNDVGEPSTLLTAAQIYVNAVVYNKLGQLTQRTLGATGLRVAITSTFDEPTRRVTTTNVVPELKPEAANWSYIYDNSGNITRIQEAPAGAAVDTQCFRYDHVRQLTDAWTPSSGSCATSPAVAGLGGPAPYWHSWTFNAIGNRLTEVRHAAAGDTTYTSTYPASGPTAVRPHALTQLQMSAPGTSWTHGYTYDNAGNTKTRLADTGNQQTLTFDPEGRLTTVVEAGATTSYLYDADGGRLIRRDPTATTLYLPDGSEVSVAAGTSTATGTRYYTHKGATIAMRTAAGVSWIVGDHHGTAELTIKASDLSSSKRRSLPYGQDRGSVPSGWPAGMDKGYVGGTKDRTGLTHLGVREYDPAIGRFISVDPVIEPSEPQQLHPYTYGHNTPVNRADPTGEWPDWLDSAVSTVASAVTTVGNAVANTVASTVESIAQDPVKFATGVAVGIVATAAVAAVCSTGVGCLILGAAVVGAASAGAEYGVDVAQGEREFSASDLMGEMAFGGATGVLTLGAGAIARKALSGARSTVSAARQAARGASGTVDDLAEGAATAGRRANSCMLSFDPDTPVLLASGAAVPIGSVQLGDQVVATDPISGVTAAEPVVSLFANRDVDLADVTVVNPDGTTAALHTTQNHPFWNATVGAWTEAGDLRPGDGLQTPSGAAVTVAGVTAWAETKTMYNLTVDALHTYYVMVGDAPVLVHNCTPTRAAPEAPSIPASNYRGRYNAERHRNGAPRLPQTWDAHHAVPQAYRNHAEFRGFDFDAPRNIRGVPGSRAGRGNNIHQSITNRWSAYQRVFPYASRVSIERRAARIDRVYARYYW